MDKMSKPLTIPEPDKYSVGNETRTGASVTAVVVVMVLFVRLMAVSGWHWTTAADIADSFDFNDAVPIIFGTLFEMPIITGAAAGVILPLAIYRLRMIHTSEEQRWQLSDWFVIALLAIILFVLVRTYQMWWPLAIAMVLGLVLVFVARYEKRGTIHNVVSAVARKTGTMVIMVICVLAVFVTTPWNVREEIVTKQGTIYGHVLETSPGFVKVLTDDREVKILLTGDVVSRETMPITADIDVPEGGHKTVNTD